MNDPPAPCWHRVTGPSADLSGLLTEIGKIYNALEKEVKALRLENADLLSQLRENCDAVDGVKETAPGASSRCSYADGGDECQNDDGSIPPSPRSIRSANSSPDQLNVPTSPRHSAISQLRRESEVERFRDLFDQNPDQKLGSRDVAQVLARRGMEVDERWLKSALSEIKAIFPGSVDASPDCPDDSSFHLGVKRVRNSLLVMAGRGYMDEAIDLKQFVEALRMPDLADRVDAEFALGVRKMQEVLLRRDVDEVINKVASRSGMSNILDTHWKPVGSAEVEETSKRRCDTALKVAAPLAATVSTVALAISRDYAPGSPIWPTIAGICTVYFVLDLVAMHWIHGCRWYWWGPEKQWNWLDAFVTVASVVDTSLWWADKHWALKLVLNFRMLRALRTVRAVCASQSNSVRELTNMLIGLSVGMQALFWVAIMLWATVFAIALSMQIAVGPEPTEESRIARCGYGDNPRVALEVDPDCQVAYLYVEEFCGTVQACTFTVFRCIVGDCTSRGGQSLTAHLSLGFGWRFDALYAVGMVVLMFGIFNVINAIFVETTLVGLKYNETKRRRMSMYKARYVTAKLRQLSDRIRALYFHFRRMQSSVEGNLDEGQGEAGSDMPENRANVSFQEEEFFFVMKDRTVQAILMDLDIDITCASSEALFDLVNPDGKSEVSLAEIIDAIMKLRGETGKIDMIVPLVALRRLRQEHSSMARAIHKFTRHS